MSAIRIIIDQKPGIGEANILVTDLQREFSYYLEHQKELVKQYEGQVIVIKDGKVLGAYQTELEALEKTKAQHHEEGTFLVQKVSAGDADYSQTFHSRVTFPVHPS